jgi:hypothetical protein
MDSGTQIIQAGVGPIIVISACGLLSLAFYNRLAAVVARLRSFHREQLQVTDALAKHIATGDEIGLFRNQEMLGMLSVQIGHVTRRARLIRCTLVLLLLCVAVMAVCSVAVGLATLLPWLAYVAAPLFVIGLTLVVVAVSVAIRELKCAMDPVELEGRFLQTLNSDFQPAVSLVERPEIEQTLVTASPSFVPVTEEKPAVLTATRKSARCRNGGCGSATCSNAHDHAH